jgi:hypothetical protein
MKNGQITLQESPYLFQTIGLQNEAFLFNRIS